MSRSRKKVPIFGHCGHSDKVSKRLANRAYRATEKRMIKRTSTTELVDGEINEDTTLTPIMNEVYNVHSFRKDGKSYWHGATKLDMNK